MADPKPINEIDDSVKTTYTKADVGGVSVVRQTSTRDMSAENLVARAASLQTEIDRQEARHAQRVADLTERLAEINEQLVLLK